MKISEIERMALFKHIIRVELDAYKTSSSGCIASWVIGFRAIKPNKYIWINGGSNIMKQSQINLH